MTNIKDKKIALVISGMLRNYDTAILSLPIWGNCDRYLVTWESVGWESITDYCNKASIKEKFIISDSEFEKVYIEPCKNGNNTFRMVYLWDNMFECIPKTYDKYIVIRPDGFYWCINTTKLLDCINTEGPFKVNQRREIHTNGISDNVLFIENSHLDRLKNCYSSLIDVCMKLINDGKATSKYGNYLDPHEILFKLWNQDIPIEKYNTDVDFFSEKIHRCIEPLWVRNTFQKLTNDKYDSNLYKAVFYDTAAHWRRSAGCNYHGKLNRLENNLL